MKNTYKITHLFYPLTNNIKQLKKISIMAFKKTNRQNWKEQSGNIKSYITAIFGWETIYYLTVVNEIVTNGYIEDKIIISEKEFRLLNDAKRFSRTLS